MKYNWTDEQIAAMTDEDLAVNYFVALEVDPDGEGDEVKRLIAEYERRGLTYRDILALWERMHPEGS